MNIRPLALALSSCLALAAPAHADIAWRYDTGGTACADFEHLTFAVHGGAVRMDGEMGGQKHGMLYDGVEEILYALDHAHRQYFEMAVDADAIEYQGDVMNATGHKLDRLGEQRAEMQQRSGVPGGSGAGTGMPGAMPGMDSPEMQAALARASKEMQAQMRDMDPATRKQMEQSLAAMRDFDPNDPRAAMRRASAAMRETVRDTGRTDTVAGLACREREHVRDGVVVATECTAELDALALDARDRTALARLFRTMTRMGENAGRMLGEPEDAAPQAKAPDGPILRRTCYDDGRVAGTATIVFDRGAADPSRFTLPAGYTPMSTGAMPTGSPDGSR